VPGAGEICDVKIKKQAMNAGSTQWASGARSGACGRGSGRGKCVVRWAEGEQAVDLDLERDMDGVEMGSRAAFPLAQGGKSVGMEVREEGDD
jgi:hypothetical protein